MNFFMEYIFPLLVGGFIGWFTNYLAIKMLFRPYKKIKIFGVGIPFTPGLIPKEKERISKSLSQTISKEFLNKEILSKYLISFDMKKKISNLLDDAFLKLKNNEKSFHEIISIHIKETDLENQISKINKIVSKEIINRFIDYNMSKKIASQLIKSITINNDTVFGKTISFLINDKLSSSLENIIQEKIRDYVLENGEKELEIIFEKEIRKFLSNSSKDICLTYEEQIVEIKKHLIKVYEVLVDNSVDKILQIVDFERVINDRIQELDVKELETIILNITKKELNAITYIGGVLGVLIGMINIFI